MTEIIKKIAMTGIEWTVIAVLSCIAFWLAIGAIFASIFIIGYTLLSILGFGVMALDGIRWLFGAR